MKPPVKYLRFERFEMNWQRLLVEGMLILLTGLTFALASILKSEAVVMSARFFSWLPVCGMIVFALGLLECLDALLAKEQRDFYRNLQVGVLDSVVGALIILGINETPERLSLLITAFLLVHGIVRMALTYALRLPQIGATLLCGLTSIVMGIMIWLEWPSLDGWFLALCLSIEIASRGWAMIMFAWWVRAQKYNPVLA
jgi:uncharacterized membrane protein HdeD (DUF308 family)